MLPHQGPSAVSEIRIGVKICPSRAKDENDPGHMGIYWTEEESASDKVFRGFFFDVTDLPDECQHPSRWRDYLFDHTVPGWIRNDVIMRDHYENRRDQLRSRTWTVERRQFETLQTAATPRQFGSYSFNPDTLRCHNCVTWAVDVINIAVGSTVLPRVREGRIKLMVTHLETVP